MRDTLHPLTPDARVRHRLLSWDVQGAGDSPALRGTDPSLHAQNKPSGFSILPVWKDVTYARFTSTQLA